MKFRTPFSIVAAFAASACATDTVAGPKLDTISYDDASAFERQLLSDVSASPERPAPLFVQPSNKSDDCKLPTTADQLDRPNFRVYWDGECENGFATGLGRDIAISDTHHVEEITIHDGTGDNWSHPRVFYDYVNNYVVYGIGGDTFPEQVLLSERYEDSFRGFSVYQSLAYHDLEGKTFGVSASPFQSERVYSVSERHGTVGYKFTDYSAFPSPDLNPVHISAEVYDPASDIVGGFGTVRFADGTVRHFRHLNGDLEQVSLPIEYANHLASKYSDILAALNGIDSRLERAQQIEREYLYKACNGSNPIEGLDDARYRKICTWRDQFKDKYAAASTQYQAQLEQLRAEAASAEQQRLAALQLVLQQQLVQQQQSQQVWQRQGRSGDALAEQTQQILQGIGNTPPPQVQPISPSNNSTLICRTVGSITMCN